MTDTNTGEISDGYHTFNELYEHRHALFIRLCHVLDRCSTKTSSRVWKSRAHADGSMLPGWFIMGIDDQPGEQISYHLPERLWSDAWFAKPLDRAPEWDGHTSADVVKRLYGLLVSD